MKLKPIVLLWFLIGLFSCSEDDMSNYEAVDEPYEFVLPSNFPELQYPIENNMPSKFGVELGRKLFYDGRLSSTGLVSCAFCHEQAHAFTHHGHNLSHGVHDRIGRRNTPATQNLAYLDNFFFDGAASNMNMVPIVPIHNVDEMDENIPSIISKLEADGEYRRLFGLAFENNEVNSTNMMKAMAQFMTIMISSNSKYDKFVRNEDNVSFIETELEGRNLFNDKCASCHATDLFTDNQFRNIGLPINPNINDLGRAEVSGNPDDQNKFKVPSLRNIELTAPYMHDGRFGSLNSVLNHYRFNVQPDANLDPELINEDGSLGIQMTDEEAEKIIAFLKTLTDYEFITNEELYFSN
jgi:cytochrome c peroxidase